MSADRSPYPRKASELVSEYAFSLERVAILGGFLKYRAELHAIDVKSGLQWIDGSFCEDCETHRGRPPGDIDVVTFFDLPAGVATSADLVSRNPALFPTSAAVRDAVKTQFSVDGYFVGRYTAPDALVGWSTYWYSLFGHRKSDGLWKGFLAVDLDPADDANAANELQLAASALGTTP